MLPLRETVKEETVLNRGSISMLRREETSVTGASKTWEVDRKRIMEWIRQYEAEGIEAFRRQGWHRVYFPEPKRRAVEEYVKGEFCPTRTENLGIYPTVNNGGIFFGSNFRKLRKIF